MGVLFVALATAVVLRTGALQLFAAALWSGATGSGGVAAAAMLLTPGLARRLAGHRQLGEAVSALQAHFSPCRSTVLGSRMCHRLTHTADIALYAV